jgi:hypothetical protein
MNFKRHEYEPRLAFSIWIFSESRFKHEKSSIDGSKLLSSADEVYINWVSAKIDLVGMFGRSTPAASMLKFGLGFIFFEVLLGSRGLLFGAQFRPPLFDQKWCKIIRRVETSLTKITRNPLNEIILYKKWNYYSSQAPTFSQLTRDAVFSLPAKPAS